MRHTRFIAISFVVICMVVVLVFAGYFAFKGQRNTPLAIIVASDPVAIIFFDTDRKSATTITLPTNTHLSGSSYSLDALWHLGALDPKDAGRLQLSLQQAFGAPIIWYLGRKTSTVESFDTDADTSQRGAVHSVLSSATLMSFLSGTYRTNMTPFQFLQLFFFNQRHPGRSCEDY